MAEDSEEGPICGIEGIALLMRTWGLDDDSARELLNAAGMDTQLAVDAWLEAYERLKARSGESWVPFTERLTVAVTWARERR